MTFGNFDDVFDCVHQLNSHINNASCGYHDLPKRTGTDRNGSKRTYEIPKRTSMGTETDRNDPNEIMYVLGR